MELVSYGCPARMHIVQLQAPTLGDETYLKDIDFCGKGIRARWQAGYENTAPPAQQGTLARAV